VTIAHFHLNTGYRILSSFLITYQRGKKLNERIKDGIVS
jgi:hypothetical protein